MVEMVNALPGWVHALSNWVLLCWALMWALLGPPSALSRRMRICVALLASPLHALFLCYGLAVITGGVPAYEENSWFRRESGPLILQAVALWTTAEFVRGRRFRFK